MQNIRPAGQMWPNILLVYLVCLIETPIEGVNIYLFWSSNIAKIIFWPATRFEFSTPVLDAIDFVLLRETLQRLKEGKKVEVPIYNFVTHRREEKSVSMYGADVLIFEGRLAFHMPEIVNMLDVKVYSN